MAVLYGAVLYRDPRRCPGLQNCSNAFHLTILPGEDVDLYSHILGCSLHAQISPAILAIHCRLKKCDGVAPRAQCALKAS